jgi:hypothetical protein
MIQDYQMVAIQHNHIINEYLPSHRILLGLAVT